MLAAIASVGTSIAIPGLGIFSAGPIAEHWPAPERAARPGGPIGLLIGTGIPEHRARVYDTGLRSGGKLLGVEAKSNEDVEKQTLLEDIGVEDARAQREP